MIIDRFLISENLIETAAADSVINAKLQPTTATIGATIVGSLVKINVFEVLVKSILERETSVNVIWSGCPQIFFSDNFKMLVLIVAFFSSEIEKFQLVLISFCVFSPSTFFTFPGLINLSKISLLAFQDVT